jgi:hypothetical protein
LPAAPAPCSNPGAAARGKRRPLDPSYPEMNVRNSILSLAAALTLAISTSAVANAHKEAPGMTKAAASAPKTAQQSKMTTCNADAGDRKGDERKAFMKTCLSASKATPQQAKMKQCNVDAAGKKGDQRKAFMKSCLSA